MKMILPRKPCLCCRWEVPVNRRNVDEQILWTMKDLTMPVSCIRADAVSLKAPALLAARRLCRIASILIGLRA